MIDFAAARRMMVDGQVRTSDVTDLRIIAAMLELPRERFVPETNAALAYLDLDVPVTRATGGEPVRRLLKPMVLAKMVQAAAVKAGRPRARCRLRDRLFVGAACAPCPLRGRARRGSRIGQASERQSAGGRREQCHGRRPVR